MYDLDDTMLVNCVTISPQPRENFKHFRSEIPSIIQSIEFERFNLSAVDNSNNSSQSEDSKSPKPGENVE